MRKLLVPALALSVIGSVAGCGSTSERVSTTSKDSFVVVQAETQAGELIGRKDLEHSVSIMRKRLKKLGIQAIVQSQGRDRVIIQFPGRPVTGQDQSLLEQPGKLEFFDLERDLTGPSLSPQGFPVATRSLFNLLAGQQVRAGEGVPTAYYLFSTKKRPAAGPAASRAELIKDYQRAAKTRRRPPKAFKLLAVPADMVVVTCGSSAVICPGVNESPPTRVYYYLFNYKPGAASSIPEMSGGDLKLSGTREDFDPQIGEPEVLLAFTGEGRKKFLEITKAEAVRGRAQYVSFGQSSDADPNNFNQHFAIVLDRDIKSFPSIDFRQDPSGIDPINGARITGLKNPQEAKNLALVLQTGALPVRFVEIKSHL